MALYDRFGYRQSLYKARHRLTADEKNTRNHRGEKDIAMFLIANENVVPFYEKLGMKKSVDVMQYHKIAWTEFVVE